MAQSLKSTDMTAEKQIRPVLPLRDVVVYPHMVIPLFVGRQKSIKALEAAMQEDKQILLVAQKSAAVDDPGLDDIYHIGTLSNILQLLKLPDGTVKVLVEGTDRARVLQFIETDDSFSAELILLEPDSPRDREAEVLMRSVLNQFDQYVKLNNKVPPEILSSLSGIESAGRLADTIAAHLSLKISEKQGILEIISVRERLEHLMEIMESEIDLLQRGKAHPRPRQEADGEEPARVLPERADEGHPEGARGAGGRAQRGRGAGAEDRKEPACPRRPRKRPPPS